LAEEEGSEQTEEQPPVEAYTQREPLISPEVKDVIDLRRFMEGGEKEKLSIVELILLQDWLDRREERMIRRNQPQIRPEDIAKAVSNAVAETIKPLIQQQQPKRDEEEPGWAKQIQEQQKTILDRLNKEEEEKKTQEIIEKAQRPLLDQIKERDMIISKLQEKLKTLEEKVSSTPATEGDLDTYLKIEEKLKKLGIKKEPKEGMIVLGEEGIPIKGEIPAWVAFGPYVADKIMSTIEKRLNAIASNFGLASAPQTQPQSSSPSELIKLPPKPQIPMEKPKPEEPETKEVKAEVKTEEPEEELIKIPEKPKMETRYTREDLEKKKMTELWKIAQQMGLSKKGKKNDLIERILKAQEEEKSEQ